MPGVEIRVQMHENKLGPFLESLPAKLAYHVLKVISEIYIHKAMNGGRPPAGYNDEAWPPLSKFTIYRKLLAEHRRRRARLWLKARASYMNLLEGKRGRRPKSDPHLMRRLVYWTGKHVRGAKEDIQAQRRQEVYGAPPPTSLPKGQADEGVVGLIGGDEEAFLRSLQRSFRARRRIARLLGVPIKPMRRASLPPKLRRFWKKVYARAYGRYGAARAAMRAWRSVISYAENLAYIDYEKLEEETRGMTLEQAGAVYRSAAMKAMIGKSFLARYRLRERWLLDSSMVLMMIDSGAIYNSLLPGTVGRDDRTGSTVYIINRRSGRGGSAEDKRHDRPGQVVSITVHESTQESPLRAEVTVGVRVVDTVEVGKGANRTVVEVPYALYHHYGPAVQQEHGRRRPRPKRRLWPADLATLLKVSLERLLRSSRLLPSEVADASASEGDGDPNR